jgi:transposase InsO family protein
LFARWGLPQRLRIDNGMPWGSRGDLPTDLACWLAGLGVGLLTNPPRRPQDNGVIERYQGVGKSWGEPQSCAAAAELQRRLDELDRGQRDLYPTADGRPRREVYPGLTHSGRCYEAAREAANWDLRRAWAWVGSHLVPRRVDSRGKVSLYNRPYFVGLMWVGRTVWIGFDPERGEWTSQDERGHEIRRQAAP